MISGNAVSRGNGAAGVRQITANRPVTRHSAFSNIQRASAGDKVVANRQGSAACLGQRIAVEKQPVVELECGVGTDICDRIVMQADVQLKTGDSLG